MATTNGFSGRLGKLLLAQNDVLSRAQALDGGMTEAALRHRLRPGGAWRIVLPGIYLATAGLPTVGQREMAALLYCGPCSVITGPAALNRHGVWAPHSEVTDVLVPEPRRRQSVGFVRVHRTIRMPQRAFVSNGLRYALAARSVADTARGLADLRAVRAVVADAVQHGRCSEELAGALAHGPETGSGRRWCPPEGGAAGARPGVGRALRATVHRSPRPPPP